METSTLCHSVVSRGKLETLASDFGALEVFGGASIAATDPFTVANAINSQATHQS